MPSPWKKSYDKPKQSIKNLRHYFANKGPYSQSYGFSSEMVLCIRWPEYWSLSFSISPSSQYSELISFRVDWFDLLALQATLKSLLQHHSSKASILWCSALFMAQISHPYMATGKTIALTIWTFVGKVTCLHCQGLS